LTLKVLFTSAEATPYAKVGGLADVVGSLPQGLGRLGVDARVILPYYGFIDAAKYQIVPLFSFPFSRRNGVTNVQVFTATNEGVTFYLVRGLPFFGGEMTVYSDWDWDVPRFIFFNQVAMAVAWELRPRQGWFPDVFHVHDWHTSLLPFLLYESRHDPAWAGVASILTIHNAGQYYQGEGVGGWLWELGVPGRHQPDLVYYDLTDNLLGIAIAYADITTAVSPHYAAEIHFSYMSHRLAGLIYARTRDVYGVLNGIDVNYWNPMTDRMIASNFNADTFLEKRAANKRQLQNEIGLVPRDDVPLIGIVSRLVAQKGFDMALPALRQLFMNTDVQFVLLGSGDPDLDQRFWRLGQDFGWRARIAQGYNEPLAHKIYAGSDIFLMPSHYEPCGIGQMIAMRYGALPLVRETGGLADTVQNYDNGPADRGTGFTFEWEDVEAVLNTLYWAINTYRHRKDAWQRMQRRAMQTDFSWDKSAREYIDLYQKALQKRRGEYKG
jgi:starch synthase